jgi:hypothetical protein
MYVLMLRADCIQGYQFIATLNRDM